MMDIEEKQTPTQNDVPETNSEAGMRNMNAGMRNQVIATTIANMSTLTVGTMLMAAIHYGKIKDGEENHVLLSSFVAIILGIFLSFFLCQFYGRQMTLCLSAIPLIVCCGLIIIDTKPAYATTAFFLQIVGSSMQLFVLPIYVSEISCNSMRGALGSMRTIFLTLGFVIAHSMYHNCYIQTAASIIIFFPVILIIGLQWMPESPIFLVRKSLLGSATRSLMWLRNNDEEWVQHELLSIMRTVKRMPSSGSGIYAEFTKVAKGLLASSARRRCFLIASGLLAAQSLCEVLILAGFKTLNLKEDNMGTSSGIFIIYAILISPILGSLLSTALMDTLGRRRLLLISCVGMFLICVIKLIAGYSIFGGYTSRYQGFSYALGFPWSIFYYIGLGTVPFIIAVEIFEREVLSFGYLISLSVSLSVMFIFIWVRPMLYMLMSFPVNPVSIVLCVFCLCCFLFTYVIVPETNGKAIE